MVRVGRSTKMGWMKERTQMTGAGPSQEMLEIWMNPLWTIRSRTVGETGMTCSLHLMFEYFQIICPCWTLEVFWYQHLSPITQSGSHACVWNCARVPRNAGVYLAPQQLSPSHTMTRMPAQRAFVSSRKECDLLRSQTWPNPSCFLSVCVLSCCPHNTFP